MASHVAVEVFHPGEYVADEMEARGWAQDDLAEVLGVSRQSVVKLLQGKSAVTPEMSMRLAAAFEQTAQTWMNLQVAYELAKVAKEDRDTARRAEVFSRVPVREMKRRNWLEGDQDVDALEDSVCQFLGIRNIKEPLAFAAAARMSTAEMTSSHGTWCCRVRNLSPFVTATKYDDGVDACIRELKPLMAYPEDVAKVPSVLADFGIRLVIVEHLKGTRIDGVATWVNDCPVIGMSLRYDRIDNFWFTLLHELVHVKYRDECPVDVDLLSRSDRDVPEMEKRADTEAATNLVDSTRLDSFIQRHEPLFYQKKIIQFAQARKVHPAIIVGQLKHLKKVPQTHLNKLQAKIRENLIGKTITDGWGDVPVV